MLMVPMLLPLSGLSSNDVDVCGDFVGAEYSCACGRCGISIGRAERRRQRRYSTIVCGICRSYDVPQAGHGVARMVRTEGEG